MPGQSSCFLDWFSLHKNLCCQLNENQIRFLSRPIATMPLLMQTGKPRVILGLMTFGPDSSAGARITSLDEYNKCLDYFQSQGYSEVDTARSYIGGRVLLVKAL